MNVGGTLRVRGGATPLKGRARLPGDKSIGHRAVIFAALSRGACHVTGLSGGEDNRATMAIFEALGVTLERAGVPGAEEARIEGVGLRGLRMPRQVLDCGNSGTTIRLLAGLLAGQRFGSRLVGDASLSRRPMGRVVFPLKARGAHVGGSAKGELRAAREGEEVYPPLSIAPLVEGEALAGLEYRMPVASAQVKSCLLLSGLYAEGPTALEEPVLSRDHTERMMLSLGVPLRTAGSAVVLDPAGFGEGWNGGWGGFTWHVPGDPSGAAFPIVAALLRRGSDVVLEGVGVNPTRTGLLDQLRLMGLPLQIVPKGEGAGGEPLADLHVGGEGARAGRSSVLGGELLVRMIDEVPALCALAAGVPGRTEIRDAQELRVKESDRLAAMASVLEAFGVPCAELPDGLIIEGGGPLRPATIASRGDHRIAMAAACLGLA
ncbi:MAG: 3-phosphoshikimate 1-carboxyvinyltransferase, partial [Myxococcota bacterium]